MTSLERLQLKGALFEANRKADALCLNVKGMAVLIRNELSTYKMLHLDEIGLEQLEANYSLFKDSLLKLRQVEAEIETLKAELQ